jgi:hypothetical protein
LRPGNVHSADNREELLTRPAGRPTDKPVARFHNKRGTAEQWIKEGKQAVKMTRLSCHRFGSNEVRLWLSVLAHNLGNRRRLFGTMVGRIASLQVKTG